MEWKDTMEKQDKPGWISRIWKGLWKSVSWLRTATANLIFLFLLVIVVAAIWPEKEAAKPEQFTLRLAPSGYLVEQRTYIDPVSRLLSGSDERDAETVVFDLVRAIQLGGQDDKVTGLVLDLDYLEGGSLSKLEEVGKAIEAFKTSGKPVIAVGSNYNQSQYFLASYADHITLHPMGGVLLTGFGAYRNYFKSALDKLEINFHVFKVGTYKDFLEPYIRDDMSEASREHNAQWLNNLWNKYTGDVEGRRNLESGTINRYINNMDEELKAVEGDGSQLALQLGLVDELVVHTELEQKVSLLLNNTGTAEKNDLENAKEADSQKLQQMTRNNSPLIDYDEYLHWNKPQVLPFENQIGLITANGVILDGDHPEGTIGSESLSELIQQARDDHSIKAVVLRIDSGGGSAFASEIIRQELVKTREVKPVIVTMGSVAASGGYWIATGGDEIWAAPSTITGSIGVFGAFPTLEDTLENMGIHTDGLGTTDLAGALRLDRPLPKKAGRVLQQGVNHIYNRFIALVASARNQAPDDIRAVAEGRVWTGSDALSHKLVDNLGYLDDAILAAASRAKLENYKVVPVRKPLSPGEMFMEELANELDSGAVRISSQPVLGLFKKVFGPMAQEVKTFINGDPRGIYAHCIVCIAP